MGELRLFTEFQSDFTVGRHRLVQVFARTRPGITVVVAPGGYGKTVLAGQLIHEMPGTSLWLSMSGCSPTDDDFPALVTGRLRCPAASRVDDSSALTALESGWERMADAVAALDPSPSVVVLDGLDVLPSTAPLLRLRDTLRQVSGGSARIICTCRSIQDSHSEVFESSSVWTVTRDQLEFNADQTRTLSEHVLERRLSNDELDGLVAASGGQAALLVLLLRHIACADGSIDEALLRLPRDVRQYLRGLLESVTDERIRTVLGIAAVLGSGTVDELAELSDADASTVLLAADIVPLIRLRGDELGVREFEMHDLACEVYRAELLQRQRITCEVDRALRVLEGRGDYHRLFGAVAQSNDGEYLVASVERLGRVLLAEASLGLLESLLLKIPASVQAGNVRLLLLGALLLRCSGKNREALERVVSGRRLAAMQPDSRLERECLLVEARLRFDNCEFGVLVQPLAKAYESAVADGDFDAAALLAAYLATSCAQSGDVERGRTIVAEYQQLSRMRGVTSGTRAEAVSMILLVLGIICGDIASAAKVLKGARGEVGSSIESRLMCEGNLAALLLELGRTRSALELSAAALTTAREKRLTFLSDSFMGTEAATRAGQGDISSALRLMTQAIESAECPDDTSNIAYNRVYRSTILRSRGMLDEALADAENALVVFSQEAGSLPIMACLARAEVAASMLALGDPARAHGLALESRVEAECWHAAYHLLRVDMVLAEIERRQGELDAAVARISAHHDYILTESANWQIAMYIRAFPGLLGLFVRVVGTDALPSHLLRMVLPENARAALEESAKMLSEDELERIAVRLLGKRAAATFLRDRASGPKVHVRLFGGMEVTTPSGVVADKDWRKRKARLLYALLVLRRGQDTPREQVFDHFWPDMDEDRAKSNFYVTWSIMKRALMGGAKGVECPYVEHVGGVCRIARSLVTSDFAEFEDALAAMRKADRAGDHQLALASAERVAEQYKGELLPGEMYDEWLGPVRDRCRQDYGDAMLRAAQICHESGDTEKALHMIRAALGQDPWREDLYQAALKYQIHTGQRSGAIETYVACKSRLAEDLGLDPSVETRRLYDQILAMEEPPVAPA